MRVIAVSKTKAPKGKDWKKTCTCTGCKTKLEVTYADLELFDDRDGRAYRFVCPVCKDDNWVSSVTVNGKH